MPKPLVPIVRKLISSSKVGVVVSAGKMERAVKVRIAAQEWNKKFRKHFPSPQTYLVADPNNSLVEGDVVRIASGWRISKHIRHVVTSIVAPFGEPVENRPAVLTEDERTDIRIKQRILKDVRSAANGRQTSMARLAQARRQGHEIPTLEQAMANARLADQELAERRDRKGKEAHKGEAGQIVSNKARRVEKRRSTKEDRVAGEEAKHAKAQTA